MTPAPSVAEQAVGLFGRTCPGEPELLPGIPELLGFPELLPGAGSPVVEPSLEQARIQADPAKTDTSTQASGRIIRTILTRHRLLAKALLFLGCRLRLVETAIDLRLRRIVIDRPT